MTQEENLHNNVQNNEENINPQESRSEEAGSTECSPKNLPEHNRLPLHLEC